MDTLIFHILVSVPVPPLIVKLREVSNPIRRLAGDITAGVSVASVIIPQSMSYATSLAHVNAFSGLLSSAIPGLVYSMFGTCAHLNVGPEAALSLLVGQAISAIVRGDPHSPNGVLIASAVSTMITFQVRELRVLREYNALTSGLQVGLISFLLGLLRLGTESFSLRDFCYS